MSTIGDTGLTELIDSLVSQGSGTNDKPAPGTSTGTYDPGTDPTKGETHPTGTPGAVSFRPGNWDAERSEYVIANGDTMVGIAALYLGSGARWQEIRLLQTHGDLEQGPNGKYLNATDSKWYVGSQAPGSYFQIGRVLVMPPEALAKARELDANGQIPKGATTPGAPGSRPVGFKPAPLTETGTGTTGPDGKPKISTGLKVAGGLAAGAVIGYLVMS